MKLSNIVSGTLIAACLFAVVPVQGEAYDLPRLADGKPDLQGTWSNASITRLQRDSRHKSLVISPEEVKTATEAHPQVVRQRTDDNLNHADGLLDGSDLSRGRGYNAFWIDPGKSFGLVKGSYRSSWIVEPKDGRIPYKDAAQGRRVEQPEGDERGPADGPESRSLGERCLIGFGGTGGPPMLNTLYNNTYQIVQTPSHLMILVEMVHDARIIPIVENAKAAASAHGSVPRWLGDSVGWWEGDTLVVETVNIMPEQARRGPVFLSEKGRIIERFSRYSDSQILYEFTVDDPNYYSKPWRAEMSFNAIDDHVYEYACHEGNIGLEGILQGARKAEAGDASL